MNSQIDPYHSRPIRIARAVGVMASWLVWAVALLLAFTTTISQAVVLLIMLIGFAPYIISLHIIEPWLMRRVEARLHNREPNDRGDD
jgi:hypothetical protein